MKYSLDYFRQAFSNLVFLLPIFTNLTKNITINLVCASINFCVLIHPCRTHETPLYFLALCIILIIQGTKCGCLYSHFYYCGYMPWTKATLGGKSLLHTLQSPSIWGKVYLNGSFLWKLFTKCSHWPFLLLTYIATCWITVSTTFEHCLSKGRRVS